MMPFNPGVSFFVSFRESDPSKPATCIFYTQKGNRCRNTCGESDKRKATALYKTITTVSNEAVCLDLLRQYVLCSCCGRAQHRDRVEDTQLLLPLAQRWLSEIRESNRLMTLVSKLEESINTTNPRATVPTSKPIDPIALKSESSSINAASCNPVANSLRYQSNFLRPQNSPNSGSLSLESQPRYNLRRCNISLSPTSALFGSSYQPPQSEFRPHIIDPKPHDSVSWKILNCLKGRDFRIGSLYIFERTSSPGYVKIGWTASSVSGRLKDWSKCGYSPDLLFSVDDIPHAQRVETLAHYELIKEWRRERMCKAPWCRKSHQEWFEINKARAQEVVAKWADFMKRAEPYDSKGQLKSHWRTIVEQIDKDGDLVTAQRLLKHHEESLADTSLSQPEVRSKSESTRDRASSPQTPGIKKETVHQRSSVVPLATLQPNLLDAAATPVESRTSLALERAALMIVNGLCHEYSPSSTNFDEKALGAPVIWNHEAPRVIEAVA